MAAPGAGADAGAMRGAAAAKVPKAPRAGASYACPDGAFVSVRPSAPVAQLLVVRVTRTYFVV